MNTNRNKIITVAIIVIMTLFLFPLSACKAGADDAAAVKKIPDASVLRVYREVRTLLLSGD
ncbi:MAG: hypothetical protein LBN35_02685, partial [Clostridiales Family XIII bacterium]|nr:hypothetical protein [Clostridiales Family XIII bacterium]